MLLLKCVVTGSYTPSNYMVGLVYYRRFDYYNVSSLGRRSTRSIEQSTLRRLHTPTTMGLAALMHTMITDTFKVQCTALHPSQVPFHWCLIDIPSNWYSCLPGVMTEDGISDTRGYSPVHFILDIAQTTPQPHTEAACRHPHPACVPISDGRVVGS